MENATGYSYHYQDADGKEVSGQTETNSVLLTGPAIGEYTIYITATSSDPEYADSEPIALKFERTKAEVWRHTGTYTSAALGKSFTATLVHYDDGSYTLENPLGEEGYSINFTIPEGSTEITPSTTADDYGYYSIYLSSKYYVSIYPSGGYSRFTGDEYAGEVWFCSYLYDYDGNQIGDTYGYDDFSWSDGDEIPRGLQGGSASHAYYHLGTVCAILERYTNQGWQAVPYGLCGYIPYSDLELLQVSSSAL